MWRYSSGNQRALGIIFTHSALSFNCNSPHPCCEYCISLIRSLHKKINKPLHKIQSTRLILRKRWKAIKKISNNFIYIIHLPMIFIIFEKKKNWKFSSCNIRASWTIGEYEKSNFSPLRSATINAVDDTENWSREEDTKDGIPGR